VGIVGPSEIGFDDAARLVAEVIGKGRIFLRAPPGFHRALARLAERVMSVPLISVAQVQILEEDMIEPIRAPDPLPADLIPSTLFDESSIRAGLPDPGRFGLGDLRYFASTDGRDRLGPAC
jgi:hypothetical protein